MFSEGMFGSEPRPFNVIKLGDDLKLITRGSVMSRVLNSLCIRHGVPLIKAAHIYDCLSDEKKLELVRRYAEDGEIECVLSA